METPWFQVFIILNFVITIDSLPFQDFIGVPISRRIHLFACMVDSWSFVTTWIVYISSNSFLD